jgi:putative NADPH-quinone reductase
LTKEVWTLKVSVILAHPDPQSFNHAIARTAVEQLQENGHEVFGDPLRLLWKNCILDLCGVPTFYRETFTVVVTSTHEQRQGWLRRVREVVCRYFAEETNNGNREREKKVVRLLSKAMSSRSLLGA